MGFAVVVRFTFERVVEGDCFPRRVLDLFFEYVRCYCVGRLASGSLCS